MPRKFSPIRSGHEHTDRMQDQLKAVINPIIEELTSLSTSFAAPVAAVAPPTIMSGSSVSTSSIGTSGLYALFTSGTLTTAGGPVFITCGGAISFTNTAPNISVTGSVALVRDGTIISSWPVGFGRQSNTGLIAQQPLGITYIDTGIPAGDHIWSFMMRCESPTSGTIMATTGTTNIQAYEL